MMGKKTHWRDAVTIVNREDTADPKNSHDCNSRGVRTHDRKLILRDRLSVRATDLREFYNLKTDPTERANEYRPEHKADISAVVEKLIAWGQSVGDPESLDLAAACRKDLGL